METKINIDAIPDSSIGKDKLSEDTQSQLDKINEIDGKQDKLISGNNIKTINGASILGEGDITISVDEEDLTEILDRVNENEKVTAYALNEFKAKLDGLSEGGGSAVAELMQDVTYSELVEMRTNNNLLAGMKYRITDYVTTTMQENTKSANHQFDIIVEAVSENELSELAQAIQHEGDTYFDGNDLGAWELWYDLDNDNEKYKWADAENGKGVIYRMIDEKRNDCPYDFKNILFYTNKYTDNTTADNYYYTFSYVVKGVLYDGTVEKQVKNCYSNSMGVDLENYRKSLNRNIFRSTSFSYTCYNNTFGNNCYNNTFGDYCDNNTFGDYVSHHKVDLDKTSITLNDEYYDDGSGQLVPIKHPDLSTQPSILPYKFMGQYVYEQLIPVTKGSRVISNSFSIEKPMIMSAAVFNASSLANIDVLAVKSTAILLKEGLSIDGYLCVKYTDGSLLAPSGGSYYGYGDNIEIEGGYMDFGVMDDGTVYMYFPSTDTLSLYNSGKITMDSIPSNYRAPKHVILEKGVTSIGNSAFSRCYGLTSITIPNSVTSIGDYAFYQCYVLTSITIPNSVTIIGNSAFWGCYGLTSITIPNSVTSIGYNAFYCCTGLTSVTIPNSVTSIGYEAFYGCDGLTSVVIGNSVTSIGERAFYQCYVLTSITIPNSVTSIGYEAFRDCYGLTSVVIGNSVTSIGDYAFYWCTGLTSVEIGNSVTSIGDYAFFNSSLTTITCHAVMPPTIASGTFNHVTKSIPVYVPAGSVNAYKEATYWKEFTNIQTITE